jgi:RNA polymerase sigma factor (sigma-70 family)
MKSAYQNLSDNELVGLLSLSDHQAYEEIYDRYWKRLYIYAAKISDNNTQAKDVVQDIFTDIFTKMSEINIPSLANYLHKAVRFGVYDLEKRDQTRRDYLALFKNYIEEGQCTTDDIVREKELRQEIDREISRLPKKMRVIFEMSRKQYLTHLQIAEASKVKPGTVKKQLYYAISKLRSKLSCLVFWHLLHAILALNKIIILINPHN